jgi:hypothetical protein
MTTEASPEERDHPPGWRRGPDPDDPPWAGRREEDGSEEVRREDAPVPSREPAEGGRDEDAPDAGNGDARDAGAGDAPDAGAGDEAGDEGPGRQLAEIPHGLLTPRPPRRTGVFLDPEDLREHVGGLLRAVLGGYEVDAFGNFTFTHEGARIFVTVGGSPIGPQVGVFSVTNLDLELTPELAAFLLTTNHTLGFGAFSYDPGNRAVWLRHTLLGTTLDLPELQTAVAAIATTAARLVERIQQRFGGRTFQEAPSDVQRRMEPPEPVHQERPPNASGYL